VGRPQARRPAPDGVAAEAAVVSGLRIDVRHQGRGLGAAAMAAMAAMARWVARRWPKVSLLTLRVDDGNTAGIRTYEKAGWAETGERRVGRVGVERTMSLRL
jgi:RimJ/RimL family protein N-acetyltransferase